jgi:nanoRNase/pAp phosphatase (c-di-AMP/oligoRNAs hydrolase)
MITPRLIPQKTDKSTHEIITGENIRRNMLLTRERPRRASTELANRLAHVLEAHRGERHLIVLHNFPDPDAISSGYAHQLLSREFGIETEIIYCGKISHQQNIALVRLSGIELMPYDQTMDLSSYDGAVYVDNQGTTCGEIIDSLEKANIPTIIVVDHHEQQERLKPEFSDIRRTGSTATIYSEYLERGLLQLNKSNKEHVISATALMQGLMTDTNYFIQASPEDLCAAGYLSRFRDADLLRQIMNQAHSRQTMEIIYQALGNRIVVESFSIAGVRYMRPEDRDAIPQAADMLLTEDNVHTSIVYGILYNNGTEEKLVGSLRTSKLTLNPDKFLKELLGKNTLGRYYGGGKELAGGFEIPVEFLAGNLSNESYKLLKWHLYDTQIKQKIFAQIGVKYRVDGQLKRDD